MRMMFAAAAMAIGVLCTSTYASDYQDREQAAIAAHNAKQEKMSGGMTEKQAIKEAINYVNKTPLGKEYKRLEKDPDAHNTYYFTKLQREYELAVDAIAEGKMVNANKGNWNNAYGDNQTSGSGKGARGSDGTADPYGGRSSW